MSEVLLIALLLATGWALLASLGLSGWGVVPFGFAAGSLLMILVGSLLAVTGSPTRPAAILGVTIVATLTLVTIRRWRPTSDDLRLLAIGLAAAVPLVLAFRALNLVSYHIDSFRYLVASGLLRSDNYSEASLNLLEKRGLSAPIVHSLAGAYGEDYVRSFAPILTLAMIAIVAWFIVTMFEGRRPRLLIVGTAVGAILLIATNNRMVWNAFYINDHLVFGVAFLVAAGAAWMMAFGRDTSREAMLVCLLLALPVLVVTRAEGFIAAALVLLPFAMTTAVTPCWRSTAVRVLGYSMAVWFGYITLTAHSRGASFQIESAGPTLLGIGLLVIAPLVRRLPDGPWGRRLLHAGEVSLWIALGFFAWRDPEILRASLAATYENQVGGAGSWGLSLIVLGFLGVVALLVGIDRALIHLRYPLTSLLPVFFLLAYLRGGAYRVGHGDSLNRMLMQVVPLLVLYAACASIAVRTPLAEKAQSRSRIGGRRPSPQNVTSHTE